ncbi:C40 family peptidase [Micromonospora sonneratiae]
MRRAFHRLVAIAAAVCVGLVPAAQAQAAPTAEEIEAQIDKQWEQLEPVIEQYNKVRVDLKNNKKKAEDLEKRIQPLSQEVDHALDQVGVLAVKFYKTGPSGNLNALLASGKPSTLTDQLTYLSRLAEHERQQVAGVMAVRDQYAAEKARLDTLIAQLTRQEAELAAKKKQIDAEIKRLEAAMPKTTVKVANCPTINGIEGDGARIAIQTACAQVGKPYVWGAAGPNSFDCSGLTQYAWGKAGVYLPHFTGDQWKKGTRVSASAAKPGDLVFFFDDLHHVGLYIGNGLMVHAPRAGKPVQVTPVRYMPVAGYRHL